MSKLSNKYGIKQEHPSTGQYHQPFAMQPHPNQSNHATNQQQMLLMQKQQEIERKMKMIQDQIAG